MRFLKSENLNSRENKKPFVHKKTLFVLELHEIALTPHEPVRYREKTLKP